MMRRQEIYHAGRGGPSVLRAVPIISATILLSSPTPVIADFQWYGDLTEWESHVGQYTTVDFTGFANGTNLDDEYVDLGLTFSGDLNEIIFNSSSYINDNWGVDGNASIIIDFASPLHWVAVDFPGIVQFELRYLDETVYVSPAFGGLGIGNFVGIVGNQPFDQVILTDPFLNNVDIDDLHFGPPIPAPASAAPFAALVLLRSGRRRRAAGRITTRCPPALRTSPSRR